MLLSLGVSSLTLNCFIYFCIVDFFKSIMGIALLLMECESEFLLLKLLDTSAGFLGLLELNREFA